MNSGRQDFRTSVGTDVNQSVTYWKGEPSGPFHFDRFCSRSRFWEQTVRLFALAGEQAGTGRDIRPVFESRNIVCSGLGKLCFPLREIFSVTQNNLPARGRKAPPKSSLFTGHPVCRDRFSSDQRVLAIFTRNWLRRASFLHITAHKNGANPAKICPERLDSIQFFANKMPSLQFILAVLSAY